MSIDRLLAIMARLRDPERGCPWDLEQDFASIAPYTVEEAYEVADAIARGTTADLKEELGDLLLQVVFHAQIARDRNLFGFDDVVDAICDKMVRRHPHVFGEEQVRDAGEQTRRWEELKRAERGVRGSDTGALDSVPVALPALTRARKLGRRAAEAGMDWPDAAGPRAKIDEELHELDEACAAGDPRRMSAELGDLLFAVKQIHLRTPGRWDLLIGDGAGGLAAAHQTHCPDVPLQRCIFHKLRNFLRDLALPAGLDRPSAKAYRQSILDEARGIWQADGDIQAWQRYHAFCNKWVAD